MVVVGTAAVVAAAAGVTLKDQPHRVLAGHRIVRQRKDQRAVFRQDDRSLDVSLLLVAVAAARVYRMTKTMQRVVLILSPHPAQNSTAPCASHCYYYYQ